jgi:hypothetical protein
MFDAIQNFLPNFPREVITDWLEPVARERGWPPFILPDGLPDQRWRLLFRSRPLSYWREIRWESTECPISFTSLDGSASANVYGIFEAAVLSVPNAYAQAIPDLQERFFRIAEHLKTTGRLPRPPVLVNTNGRFDVIDGNHRLAAFCFFSGQFACQPPTAARECVNPNQTVWVGQSNQSFNPDPATRGRADSLQSFGGSKSYRQL